MLLYLSDYGVFLYFLDFVDYVFFVYCLDYCEEVMVFKDVVDVVVEVLLKLVVMLNNFGLLRESVFVDFGIVMLLVYIV